MATSRAMDLIVIGGGCYGCYHTRQLLKAQRRGTIAARRFLVVDRNPDCRALTEFADEPLVEVMRTGWADFLRAHLAASTAESDDQLVPTPFAPHLLFDWLLAALRDAVPQVEIARAPCDLALGLPYERGDTTGNRFISAAGWLCPATCIEPARCPAIHDTRTWELGEIVRAAAVRVSDPYTAVELFTCRHFAFGIGTISVASLAAARDHLANLLAAASDGQPRRVLIGTVSSCHGVLGELVVHPPTRSITPGPSESVPAQAGDLRRA